MVSETAAKFCTWTPSREYITGHFLFPCFYCCSVDKSFPTSMDCMQHASLLCPPLSPRGCSDSYPLSWWCYLNTSTSTTLFSFYLQSFPASGSFLMSQLFISGGWDIGTWASALVLPMSIQDWFPLELTGLIPCSPRDSQESLSTPQVQSINLILTISRFDVKTVTILNLIYTSFSVFEVQIILASALKRAGIIGKHHCCCCCCC